MTAPTRRIPAALHEHWLRADEIRAEWHETGRSTAPADRPATEAVLTRMYARAGRPRPEFRWVDSPRQALPLVTGLPDHAALQRWVRRPRGRPPLMSDLAAGWSRLTAALDDGADDPVLTAPRGIKKGDKAWPALPALDGLAAGLPLQEVLRRHVRGRLWEDLRREVIAPVRAALGPFPVCWYGQQDAPWIAYYDVVHRLGLARWPAAERAALQDWADLARSTGWWWPDERVCVVVERPVALLRYRDGFQPPGS